MNDETLVVPDVHQFPGYISCDAAAMSEVVIPIHDDEGKVTAVLDIDSATLGRFSDEDSEEITALKNITEYITVSLISSIAGSIYIGAGYLTEQKGEKL